MYKTPRLFSLLSILFNICFKCAYLPKTFMQSLIIPLIKNKCGSLTDVDN